MLICTTVSNAYCLVPCLSMRETSIAAAVGDADSLPPLVWLIVFFCTLDLRFNCVSHKNLITVVSLSEARQQIMMVKMAGDLDGLLDNAEFMGKVPKAKLMT